MQTRQQLQRELERLHDEVAQIRTEICTQRLVVIDPDGHQRAVITANHTTTSIKVTLPGQPGRSTGVELFATETPDGPEAGVAIYRDGEVVAVWPEPGLLI